MPRWRRLADAEGSRAAAELVVEAVGVAAKVMDQRWSRAAMARRAIIPWSRAIRSAPAQRLRLVAAAVVGVVAVVAVALALVALRRTARLRPRRQSRVAAELVAVAVEVAVVVVPVQELVLRRRAQLTRWLASGRSSE